MTENREKINFAHFWFLVVIQVLKCTEYFCSLAHILGFTGFEILTPVGTPKTFEGLSFNLKNLLGKKFGPKTLVLG